jgi:hypothetical protein
MVASAARIAANLANSAKSTGPKSTEGKARSRGNSLKHGFCSTVVVHPDDLSKLAVDPADTEAPASPEARKGFDGWLAGQASLCTIKIERCQEMERAVRKRVMLRASISWDEDRRLEVVLLGSKLAGRPEEVVARLRDSFHGCAWLMERWAMLAYAADAQGGTWTPEQVQLAFDLMATPSALRLGHQPGTSIDEAGKLIEETSGPADVARREITKLGERVEALRPVEAVVCEQAEAGLSDDDPELRRLRRYEAELHRRMKWAIGMMCLKEEQASGETPTPEAQATPPGPIPVPQPSRPSPAARPSRAERRLVKAESRREAKRRKLDRLLN